MSFFTIARSNHFGDVVDLPRTLLGAHLLALVAEPTIGEVLVVERERRPGSAGRRGRLSYRTVVHAVLNKVCCGLVAGIERHERCRRIDSLTACGRSTIKTKNYNETKKSGELKYRKGGQKGGGDTEGMHELLKHRDGEDLRYAVNHEIHRR